MNIAELILNTTNVYNGHNQMNVTGVSSDDAKEIMKALQAELPYHLVCLRVYSDDSWCIEQENFWKEGEHPNGHKDKLLISGEL